MRLPLWQRRRDKTPSSMRTMPTTRADSGSHLMSRPSTQVVQGLLIACFESIRICRTFAIHDRTVSHNQSCWSRYETKYVRWASETRKRLKPRATQEHQGAV